MTACGFPIEVDWARELVLSEALNRRWRGVRVVESARLESVYTRNGIEGSNPSLSARIRKDFRKEVFSYFKRDGGIRIAASSLSRTHRN